MTLALQGAGLQGSGSGVPPSGAHYLNVPTASGASTPHQAGLVVGTGTLDIRAEIAPTSWNTGAYQSIITQYVAGAAAGSRYGLWLSNIGKLELDWYAAGAHIAASSVATGFAANFQSWVRVVLNISGGTCNHYTSTDGASWTPLGSQLTGLVTTAMDTTGTAPIVRVGTDADNDHFLGKVFHTQVLVGGTTILNEDWTNATAGNGPWVATTGETWTRLGTATVI